MSTPETPEPPGTPPIKDLPGGWAFVGIGTTIAGCVATGVVLGLLLDRWLGVAPGFLLVGFVSGSIAAAAAVAAQVRRFL